MIHSDSIVRRNPDIIAAGVDEEVVMMSADCGQYFGLSSLAAHIWRLTEEPVRIDNLVELLCQHYDIDPVSCEADTLDFAQKMLDAGLFEEINH
ncbi:PqqD family peptide modification chaperone [Billgrantia montanilacus]|uniref:PqqD family protein n=1 Tax=Billgrantia montanilacus TaxID=2282305 RepID=A0A368U1T5_9GAMM|nr:PqqD family peptide modification chaperone [Halomonas montanilacus]RCV91008.1 PqqD family protein [Halomonas montanilacus]